MITRKWSSALKKENNRPVSSNRDIRAGESINLNNILFNLGKADLKAESFPELDKVVAFMQANPSAEIELSGPHFIGGRCCHKPITIVQACTILQRIPGYKGIDQGRVIAVGYGPDRPEGNRMIPSQTALKQAGGNAGNKM